jgi:integrase
MQTQRTPRRAPGSGSILVRRDTAGRETFYGKWTTSTGRQIKRRLGLKRQLGTREGLTRRQAEAKLRQLMGEVTAAAPVGDRLTLEEVGQRYQTHLQRAGRKHSTRSTVETVLRVHLLPRFAGRSVAAITHRDVLDFVAALEAGGLAPKTIRNYVGVLSGLFSFAMAPQRRWATANPCAGVELPAVPEVTEIRWLDLDELELLIDAVRPGPYQAIDRALYRTAAMTGLRQGELVALRWLDIDWTASRIRVRQNYVRGEFGTPKSRRSTRSVPMADEVAGELERLFQASAAQAEGDLVFADPRTLGPLQRGTLYDRYADALTAARLPGHHTFHDLRHTFGTRMAAAGVPMRTLQEWMGHRDLQTTMIYADYAPNAREAEMVAAAFARADRRGTPRGTRLSESEVISENLKPANIGDMA